jgi:predicted N-acetyltransferase YhbS
MSFENIMIRISREEDREAIQALHRSAFGAAEGDEVSALADALQDDPTSVPRLSLVAEKEGDLLGHVLFTAVWVGDRAGDVPGQILAPLGVIPGAQGQGVGGILVRSGLERLRREGTGLVFVLGHPGYYPRFGFEPAGRLGFKAPYPIPDEAAEAWMVQELSPGFIGRVSGTVRCCEVLDRPEHWQE